MLGNLSLGIKNTILKAHSFARATLSENCSLLRTDNAGPQTTIPAYFRARLRLLFV